MSDLAQMILLGEIVSTHGVKGAVKIHSFTEYPEDILNYPLQTQKGDVVELRYHSVRKSTVVAFVEGVNSMDDAEKLRKTKLYTNRDQLPEAEEGEFYIEDLQELEVRLQNGERIGVIKKMHNFGAGDIVEIAFDEEGKSDEMFAFLDPVFPEVNLADGYVIFVNPDEVMAKEK